MKRCTLVLIALLVTAAVAVAEDNESPHHMTNPNGTLDMEKCGVCHADDMSLVQSKRDTCMLCHSVTEHAGAAEHLDASAAAVARLQPPGQDKSTALPLDEEGRFYCGTCHLFHDPAMKGPQPLAKEWVPPSTGLPGAVAHSLQSQWGAIASKYGLSNPGAECLTTGTHALRLPIDDGSLCRHCHGALMK